MTLTDADTSAPGQQVALNVGDNVIKVKVTAEDGTTKTYAVTVNRLTPTCTLNAGDIWCGVVTVGTITSSGTITGYGFTSSVGNLSDTGFSVGTNNYTISQTSVVAPGDCRCRHLGRHSDQRPHRCRQGKAGPAYRRQQRHVRVQRCVRFWIYLQLGGCRPRLVVDAERHAAAAGLPHLDGRDAERARGQRRPHGRDADADLRVGHVRLRRVGGEPRRRGDGDADDDRRRRGDRISERVRHDARRRGHDGRPAGGAGGGRQRHQGEGDGRGRHDDPDLHGHRDAGADLHAEHRRRRHLVRGRHGGNDHIIRDDHWIRIHFKCREPVRHRVQCRNEQLHD